MSRRLWALVTAVGAGCSPVDRLPLDPGPGVELLAVVELDAGGGLLRATELVPWVPTRGLAVYSGAAETLVLGWRRDDLMALGAQRSASGGIAGALVGAVGGCTPTLPAPIFAARVDGEALRSVAPAALPSLSAPWLDEACPDIAPERIAFDLGCTAYSCAQRVTRRGACTFSAELECGPGRLDGRVTVDGRLCIDAPTCAPSSLPPGAAGAWRCAASESCEVAGYVAPSMAPFVVRERAVLEVPPYSPPPGLTGAVPALPPQGRLIGYLHDLVVTPRTVLVSAGPGAPLEGCASSALRGTVHRFDPDTMEDVGTSTAPACLARLVAEPSGRITGVFIDAEGLALGRVDDAGRVDVLHAARVEPRSAEQLGAGAPRLRDAACDRPTALVASGDALALVFDGSRGPGSCAAPESAVYTYDAATLSPRGRFAFPGASLIAATVPAEGELLVADTTSLRVRRLDLASGVVREEATIPRDVGRNDRALVDVVAVGAPARWLVSSTRNDPALYVLDAGQQVRARAVIFDVVAGPHAAVAAPYGGERLLVASTHRVDQDTWPTYLSSFDTSVERFLPGHAWVGHGVVGTFRVDAQRRVWATLPWSARLLRLDPRP